MSSVVKVISSQIDKMVRSIKFLRYGKADVQNVPEIAPFGIDGNPLKDMIAIYIETGVLGKNYVIGYINRNQIAQPGELRLYSLDADGKEKAYQYFKKDGTIEVLGTGDYFVRYNKLETAYNQLKQDHNTLLAAVNTWATSVGSILSVPWVAQSPSTGNIAPAKIKEIKTTS